jgi:hypothetical protein
VLSVGVAKIWAPQATEPRVVDTWYALLVVMKPSYATLSAAARSRARRSLSLQKFRSPLPAGRGAGAGHPY